MQQLRERLQEGLGSSYIIERELDGGGMARLFVAEETSLGRKVPCVAHRSIRRGDAHHGR